MGIILVLAIIIIVVLVVQKFAGQNAKLKSDQIEFDTQKTAQQIASVLRSFGGDIERLDDDPLDNGSGPAIAVLMSGKATLIDAAKHFGAGTSDWGVQVIVDELGNKRHVTLIAVGESGLSTAMSGYATQNNYFNLRHSKDYRDRIAQLLA